jgi:hypothetical protein
MSFGRIFWAVALCAWIALVILVLYPVRNTALKILLLLCAGISFVTLVALVRVNLLRVLMVVLVLGAVLVVAFGPARPAEPKLLRQAYVERLQTFAGLRYVWGGENRRGVDCSGLIRAAWIEALFMQGAREKNPGLMREAFLVWWHDASARHLGEGFGTRTRRVQEAASVRWLDARRLQPGDLAVVAKGVHILAYLGDNQWIEADPGERRVLILDAKDKNPWLDSPAVMMRWTALLPPPAPAVQK